jgi:hypothetical protein
VARDDQILDQLREILRRGESPARTRVDVRRDRIAPNRICSLRWTGRRSARHST